MSIKYARLMFADGDVGSAILDAIEREDTPCNVYLAMGEALVEVYDNGEYHDVHDTPSHGALDSMVAFGTYLLTFHKGLHYVGLEKRVTEEEIAGERVDDAFPWCYRCGEWIDYCSGHGADEPTVEDQDNLVQKFVSMLTDGVLG